LQDIEENRVPINTLIEARAKIGVLNETPNAPVLNFRVPNRTQKVQEITIGVLNETQNEENSNDKQHTFEPIGVLSGTPKTENRVLNETPNAEDTLLYKINKIFDNKLREHGSKLHEAYASLQEKVIQLERKVPKGKKRKTPAATQQTKIDDKDPAFLYELKVLLEEKYCALTGTKYVWRDRDWQQTKALKGLIREKVLEKTPGLGEDKLREQIKESLTLILKHLPAFYADKNLSPASLVSGFNSLFQEIKTKINGTNDKTNTGRGKPFDPLEGIITSERHS
jgi:superfamily II DNA helicase RecQ